MTTQRHYTGAPITEAVLEVLVHLPEHVAIEQLRTLHEHVAANYPQLEDIYRSHLDFSSHYPPKAETKQIGYRFLEQDNRHLIQARLDGFAYSRLAPYDTWESFRDTVRPLWELYRQCFAPITIDRLALRYINRLDLPLPFDDFREYLRVMPDISSDLPQALDGYFMQIQLSYPEWKTKGVINQALVPSSGPAVASILLDIELYEQPASEDEDAIWSTFEQLRVRKNTVFEACITDKMRELIR